MMSLTIMQKENCIKCFYFNILNAPLVANLRPQISNLNEEYFNYACVLSCFGPV